MIYDSYWETGSTDPAYNLAFEEYIFTHCTKGNILILWQNDNAVIVGRNQNTAGEIDMDFVRRHGIRVIRRNTGGGAVYHDLGNLNYSLITDDSTDRTGFTAPIVQALQRLGLDAASTGRNDILVSGKKVSGTAQQVKNGRILHHGTLLFDSNSAMIAGALTPDSAKFQSKSVKSVSARVGNIRSFLQDDMTVLDFWNYLKSALGQASLQPELLPDEANAAIARLKQEKYDTWEWNFGKSPVFDVLRKKRFDRGTLEIGLTVKNGVIQDLNIFGDFLSVAPVSLLTEGLTGCRYRKKALLDRLNALPVKDCLGGITAEECIELMLYG